MRILSAGIVVALLTSGGAEALSNVKSAKFPTTELKGNGVSVVVCLPDAKEGFYRGTRFDWGSMILRATFKGHEFFTAWRHPTTFPEVNHGAGPAEEFDIGTDGIPPPATYAGASPGQPFLKIGVGWLKRKDDTTYGPFTPYEMVNGGTWAVQADPQRIEIVQTLPMIDGYAYRYRRIIRLLADAPGVEIERTLFNTGEKSLHATQYCHNFILIDGDPVGPSYRVELPSPFALNGAPPGAWRVEKNVLTFDAPLLAYSGRVASEMSAAQSGELFTVLNTRSGAAVQCTGTRPLLRMAFFAGPGCLCPEPYLQISVPRGGTVTWSTCYRFSAG